jgi:transcriptional repressor NrdR
MFCPKCKNRETKVIDSRMADSGRTIRRRRECEKCEFRFTTFERMEMGNFVVIKKDKTRETYNREKLERGIWIACGKRPVTQAQINTLLSELEKMWMGSKNKEIASQQMGKDVMKVLKELDEIAYIRFASVYRNFKDVEAMKMEIGKLLI